MPEQLLSVNALNAYMQKAVRSAPFLQSLRVRGEISNFKAYSSGHWYFTLKDDAAAVSCVMFKGYNQALDFKPENGQAVELGAAADFYTKSGQFQLIVKSMLPEGRGLLHQQYERLRKKLEEEGLFADALKRPLPFLPRRIGVVTSPSGAVIRDIIHVLGRRFPNFRLLLVPCQVQGEGAAASMVAALERLNAQAEVDVVIIGRGGGSLEDLWAFNDEALVRAVRASRVPVISAVGHETDFTLCDFAADRRAPTPSAAAELAVPEKSELLRLLGELTGRGGRALRRNLREKAAQLKRLSDSPFLRRPHHILDARQSRLRLLLQSPVLREPAYLTQGLRQDLDALEQRLARALPERVRLAGERLEGLRAALLLQGKYFKLDEKKRLADAAARLDALSPLRVLTRGYALVSARDGSEVYSSVAQLRAGQGLRLEMADGRVEAEVKDILRRNER